MPIRPIESGPLTSREIKELDGFLLAEDGLENPMDFSEWLRWVWDQEQVEQPPEFKSGSRRSAF